LATKGVSKYKKIAEREKHLTAQKYV